MITKNEKEIVKEFKQTIMPPVYKLDHTDNILYVEHVYYDLCDLLLKNKKVSSEYVQNEFKEFAHFLIQLDISAYDNDAKNHLNLLINVVNIFINNNL